MPCKHQLGVRFSHGAPVNYIGNIMIINEPIILDNVLPEIYADRIYNTIFTPGNFPYYFVEDITSIDSSYSEQTTMGFAHVFMNDYNIKSQFFDLISSIPKFSFEKCGINYNDYKIVNARSFLQIPQPNTRQYDNAHIDFLDPHIVCLYYVNDSDAETYIFGKEKDSEITQKIKPKRNRAIVFDGLTYHSSSNPAVGKRVIINFNLLMK